jgi:hypothetical protein
MLTLASGQVAAADAPVYTVGAGVSIVSAIFDNTSGSTTETVVVKLVALGATARRVARAVLAPNEQLLIQGLPMSPGDVLSATTTDATTVDYTVFSSTGELRMQTLDANGALKGTSAGVTGNQSVGGKLTAKLVEVGPQPADVYAATMTIDVTYGLHIVSAVSGTSATCAMTPSAAGTAGDEVTIVTEADASGTVTTTYASTFHSSGTQATTASHSSSVTFVSDGVKWVEKCRTTNLA